MKLRFIILSQNPNVNVSNANIRVHPPEYILNASTGKVIIMVFWDYKGPIYCDYLEEKCTIKKKYCCDSLKNKGKSSIRRKCPSSLSKCVILVMNIEYEYFTEKNVSVILL